ncbi:protein MOS2 [Tanacetum coccineum]
MRGKIHLRNDLEKLPDDRGFKEFEGMSVESFAATLLKGCGWNGVVGTKKKDRPIKLDRKGLGYAEYEAQMINAVKEGEANKVVMKRKRSREKEDLWLVSGIRVRFVSQELKDGSLFFREGVVFDVVGVTGMCDMEMDDTREVIRGVQPEFLENVLPRDIERETALVLHADTNEVFRVNFEHIAEFADFEWDFVVNKDEMIQFTCYGYPYVHCDPYTNEGVDSGYIRLPTVVLGPDLHFSAPHQLSLSGDLQAT